MKLRNIIIAAATVLSFSASAQTYNDQLVQCAEIAKTVQAIRKAIDEQDLIQAMYLQDQIQQRIQSESMQERYINAVHTATTKRFTNQRALTSFLMLECTH